MKLVVLLGCISIALVAVNAQAASFNCARANTTTERAICTHGILNDADVKIGKPVVEGAKVVAKVVEHGKADKIFVFKYKAKSNYRKRQGHRQPFTTVEITAINA